jgi:hypothetical protein
MAGPRGLPRQAVPALPVRKGSKLVDRYFIGLCLVLLGYALGGRGFAYWGVNPLFVGEIMLLIGCVVMLYTGAITRVLRIRWFIPLIAFMCWGAVCTFPHLDKYGKDSIRDAVVWGYGTFAFIMAALLISEPSRLQRLVIYYQKFVFWFLVIGPFVTILCVFAEDSIPPFPGGVVPLIQVKGGDLCVHLAGVFAYVVGLGSNLNPWLAPTLVPVMVGLNIQGRAGMVAFFSTAFISSVLMPFHPRAMRIFFVLALGLFMLWAVDLKIERGPREISFRMLIRGFESIVGEGDDDAMEGSKEWRIRWWRDIIDYTFHGEHFWTGKGFGVNLATDDGYDPAGDGALRSPHNGHLTMLARAGVPGLTFWLLTQLVWGIAVAKSYFHARKRRLTNWAGMFMFLGCYWVAFLANATFDVFLEGPMGGIWFYNIYGAGLASVYLYSRYPRLLTPVESPERAFEVVPARSSSSKKSRA